MRMIFVNLPVRDLERSKAFFTALGFSINPQFSNETSASIVVDETIFFQLHTHARFKDFITGEIGDAFKATQVLNALSAASRAEVEEIAAKAKAAGATPWMPAQDHGFMYLESFQDLDGHVWEVFWMDPAAVQKS
ncbi:VOC family protein [Hyphomicrobium sp. LHD-15]|uniref:VOC family protein n=1 Tax=Hyphomicrobium sp. LHD-15 TaxID=3072142 RepID=UPI00280CE824|nr:VOC family protein [Hyphomicrobium sp. LHD-15]MDQ8698450.1 VOC family protein [Hyphomicrobium sp. LHD-15]